ncbi:DHX36, partial [Symbiodinium sp. KB8]
VRFASFALLPMSTLLSLLSLSAPLFCLGYRSFKSPFVMPIDKKDVVDRMKRKLANDTQSDHFALLK